MSSIYFIRASDTAAYAPANHSGTTNRRLIGPDVVGARNVEVVLGIIERDHGAARHSHPAIEQVCYVLEGEGVAEIGDQRQDIQVGDCCFCPANTPHMFRATTDTPLKVLVIYSPPYMENPDHVHRSAAGSVA